MKLLTRTVVSLAVAIQLPAFAVPVYLGGGTGGVSFGVSDYGGLPPGVPTYILNNVNGRTDILSSPGGTFLTANPVVANNLSSSGILGLNMGWFQIGGFNVNGPFGAGDIAISPTQIGFSLSDPVAGGGSASYGIGSWQATFGEAVGYAGNFGSYLAIGGGVPNVGSAAVAALRTHITSANAASPFFGGGLGIDLPQLVLANSQTAPGVFSFVALGGTGAAMLTDIAGNFRGLAINNAPIVIPAGDVFTVESTLTIYADPAHFDVFDPQYDANLIAATGTTLPGYSIAGVPEPGTLTLLVVGCLAWLGRRFARRH